MGHSFRAAQTGTARFDHRQRRGHRHSGIEGIASLLENFLARLTRKRIGTGNGAFVRNGRMSCIGRTCRIGYRGRRGADDDRDREDRR